MSKVIVVDEYKLEKCIGKGSYGEVYFTSKEGANIPYATKRMKREEVEDPSYVKYFINEITIMKELYHKNIIKIEALKKTSNHYYIIMDYCNGGTLKDNYYKYKMKYGTSFPEKIIQHILRQMVEAVAFLHSKNIVHRDLKSENILIHFNSEEAKNNIDILNSELKLIDFGTATHKINNTIIGSPLTMDPLILKMITNGRKEDQEKLPYDEKIDIWSLGIISYQLFTGSYPFISGNYHDLMNEIEKGDIIIPINISAEAISFLLRMLQYSSEKRFNAAELLKHPFIQRYIGDFSFLDKKILHNFIKNGSLNVNIKDTEGIDSILNQYINPDKNSINLNSTNNNSKIDFSLSIGFDSFSNSAPIIKEKKHSISPTLPSNYSNSAILNSQKEKQFEEFEDFLGELKIKERQINNENQNLYNSSPLYIIPKNSDAVESAQPFQNSMIDISHNNIFFQKGNELLNNENKPKFNQNIPQKSLSVQNNNQYNPTSNNPFQSEQKDNQKDSIGVDSTKNKNESSKIINSFYNKMNLPDKYSSMPSQMMNSVSGYPQNYEIGANNIIFDNSLNTQNFNSSTPILGLKNFNNY